ncbi:MAG: SPOR domain-containing protein [Balneolaceae bacterium]
MNRKLTISYTVFLIIIFLIFASSSHGQQAEGRIYSATLHSGVSFASSGGFLGGSADISSTRRHIIGGSFQYVMTPTWSIEGALHGGKLTNRFQSDPFFENNFVAVSFRGVTNLNNLLELNWSGTNLVNPYLTFGLGIFHSSITSDELNTNDIALSFIGGTGVSFFLNRWADLFLQYDYYLLSTDLLDSMGETGSSDNYAAFKSGIRINFGRDRDLHPSWQSPVFTDRRPAATREIKEGDDIAVARPAAAKDKAEERDTAWLSSFSEFYNGPLMNREILAGLRIFLAERKSEIEKQRIEAEAAKELAAIQTRVPDGQYIQIRSIPDRQEALAYRNQVISDLTGVLANPAEHVLLTPYQNNYRVLIGSFQSVAEARALQRNTGDLFSGSFIITYPRHGDVATAQLPATEPAKAAPAKPAEKEPEMEAPPVPVVEEPVPPPAVPEQISENIPDGQYIQIRSIPDRQEALAYRNQVISDLTGVLANPAERVRVVPFQQTFRILIGPFGTVGQARLAQSSISDMFEGSFIITYPRP